MLYNMSHTANKKLKYRKWQSLPKDLIVHYFKENISSYISSSISSSLFVLYLSHLNPFFSLCLIFVYFFFPFSFSTFPLIHVLHFSCVSRFMSIFVYHRRILRELVLPFLISACIYTYCTFLRVDVHPLALQCGC